MKECPQEEMPVGMFMKMRKIVVALLLVALALPAFASTVTVEWQWTVNDPAVQFFRYQVDGEDPNLWEYVPCDVTSYSISGVDGSRSYALYLQQSYDGRNWSASSVSVSQPYVVEDPAPVEPVQPVAPVEPVQPVQSVQPVEPVKPVEPAAPVEPVQPVDDAQSAAPVEAVEEPAPVETEAPSQSSSAPVGEGSDDVIVHAVDEVETPVPVEPVQPVAPVEAPVPVEKPSTFRFTLSFAGGVGINDIPSAVNYDAQAGITLGFEDIVASTVAGFDVKLALGGIADPLYAMSDISIDNVFAFSQYSKALYADLLLGGNLKMGSTELYLDLGARLLAGYGGYIASGLFSAGSFDFVVQPTAVLGLRFNIGSLFNLFVEGQYVLDMGDFSAPLKNMRHSVTPRIGFGFTF